MCVAAAIGGAAVAGVAGSAISAGAAKDAAGKQADAANNASQMQWDQFQQLQKNLQPYMDLGQTGINGLQGYLNDPRLNQSFSFNANDLQNTPGYQFALQQGLKSSQNQMAARGLGYSGAQIKGAQGYATGLADQTYNQQYQNALQSYMTNQNTAGQQYNRYAGLAGLGQNAAAGVGNAGLQTATNSGNALMGGAAAGAAGQLGAANAISNGIGGLGNSALTYSLLGQNSAGSGSSLYGTPFSSGVSDPSYGVQAPAGLSGFGYGG